MDTDLIHDWNLLGGTVASPTLACLDETLAESVLSTAVCDPGDEGRRTLLSLSVAAGFKAIDLGVRVNADTILWFKHHHPSTHCAISTYDLHPVGPLYVLRFGGVNEVRVHAALSDYVLTAEATSLARKLSALTLTLRTLGEKGLPAVWVAEDATRTSPTTLATALRAVQDAGVTRVCLADSVGIAMPLGVERLFHFVRETAPALAWDWSGRNDRGLAVVNALAAIHHGSARICGTALGLGEGAGVIPLDTLLTNLALTQECGMDLVALKAYCFKVAELFRVRIPVNYPVLGEDAFRTATGVHAAAILKARKKGDVWLADRVYSGIPAALFGLGQRIDIGPMSGISNVSCWLEDRQKAYTPDDVTRILKRAKQSNRTLTEEEVLQVLQETTPTD